MSVPIVPQHVTDETVVRKYGKHVCFRKYQMPDGRVEDFLCLLANVVPVIGMPVTNSGNVVLVRQFRYAVDGFVYEFPGGCPEPGDSPEETFRRELDEEIGYACNGEVHRLSEPMPFEPASLGAKYQAVLATGCVYRHAPKPDPNEFVETVEMPLDEFIARSRNGSLPIDSKTAAITFFALPLLDRF